jgi:probable phosphoglycerate mutase
MQQRIAGRAHRSLSTQGLEEVQALAARVSGMHFARIYTSPLERTLVTARVLAKHVSCELSVMSELIELHYGSWTEATFAHLQPDDHWQRFNQHRSGTRIPGGETMLEVQSRVVHTLLALRARHPQEQVMVISHADVIRAALLYFLGMPMDFYGRLELGPTSISQLELGTMDARILRINDLAHLESAARPLSIDNS